MRIFKIPKKTVKLSEKNIRIHARDKIYVKCINVIKPQFWPWQYYA